MIKEQLEELNEPAIIVLIATTPRIDTLLERALPSIQAQTHQPIQIVIVSDRRKVLVREQQLISASLSNNEVMYLTNKHTPGVAGSWNTGIEYIHENFPECFVAILDDDDTWAAEHLQRCWIQAKNHQVVLSGINVVKRGNVITTNMPNSLCTADFLIGNPGWQGSNTFIHIGLLEQAGGFSDGLISCNDRDLAIRVLDLSPEVSYTGVATVFWYIDHRDDALSAKRSPQKLIGASQFYRKYHHRMTTKQKDLFFNRIETFFQWCRFEIEDEVRNNNFEHQHYSTKDTTSINHS